MPPIEILIVDDEQIARQTLLDILTLEGYAATAVADGYTAMDLLQTTEFDIMVLDLKMPGMDGMEVLHRVVEDYPDIQVILLTAYGSMESAIKALRYRVHDYLTKPISPEEILGSIRKAVAVCEQLKAQRTGKDGDKQQVFHLPSGIVVDCNQHTVYLEKYKILLTPTEARLMAALLSRYDQVVTHSELVRMAHGYQLDQEEAGDVLRPTMSRLRRKLADLPAGEEIIITVRGAGYMIGTLPKNNS